MAKRGCRTKDVKIKNDTSGIIDDIFVTSRKGNDVRNVCNDGIKTIKSSKSNTIINHQKNMRKLSNYKCGDDNTKLSMLSAEEEFKAENSLNIKPNVVKKDGGFSVRGKVKERRFTNDGYPIYDIKELINKRTSVWTDDCPFDCECCS